jgi:hypothetical protein
MISMMMSGINSLLSSSRGKALAQPSTKRCSPGVRKVRPFDQCAVITAAVYETIIAFERLFATVATDRQLLIGMPVFPDPILISASKLIKHQRQQ